MAKFNRLRFIFLVLLSGLATASFHYPPIWIAFSLVLISGIALLITGVFRLKWQLFAPAIHQLSSEKILLTFDDGPNEHTIEVLDVLKKHHVKALFFVIGKQVEVYPEILKQLITQGHQIGNHAYNHHHADAFKNTTYWINEIAKTNYLIEKATGHQPTFFRPPFGVMNPTIAKASIHFNMKVIGWSFRSFDTVKTQHQVLEQLNTIQKGNILLFHDNLTNSASLIDAMITQLQLKGFIFADPEEIRTKIKA